MGMQATALMTLLTSCSKPQEESESGGDEAQAPRSLDEIYDSWFINVGILTDADPLACLGSDGHYSGFDGYFCLHMAEKMSIGINYVAVDPKDRYEVLKSNKVDMCLVQMSPSDELAEGVEYAGSLYQLQLGVVSRNDAAVTSAEQLATGELIVCEGSYAQQYAEGTWPEVTLRPYATYTDAFVALEEGQGIALLADEVIASGFLKKHDGFTLGMQGIGEPRTIAPAVVAGQAELLAKLENAVSTFYTYGYARKGFDKYVKPNVVGDYASMLTAP